MNRVTKLTLTMALAAPVALGEVTANSDSPVLRFASDEITMALKGKGEDARVFLGAFETFRDRAAKKPPAVAEAFTITRSGSTIVVAGHDQIGAMYGGLEAAEQIALGGVNSVVAKEAKPFLALRQFKYNFPAMRDQGWIHSEEYWRSFFGLLAKARMNSVGFWRTQPFSEMIRFKKFPEAAILSPEQTARNIRTWRMVFRFARERGISTFLINWNIHLPPPFAKAHNLKTEGEDAPVVRQFMRYCVAQTLKTYPDLTGIGACAGERLPSDDYDWREQWIKDTFIAGIRDSGRIVPLLHRYWWASCDSLKRIICADYTGQILVPLKFNGEQMYSGFRPHFLDEDWIDFPDYRIWLKRKTRQPASEIRGVVSHMAWIPTKPYPYKIVWHLRNDTIHTYRWGDPDFVRRVVRNSRQDYSVGYLMGEERTQRGIDDELTEEARQNQTWKYHHERHWFRFMLWGRLGYDPTIPDGRWIALFEKRFGKQMGRDLFTAYQQASKVIPLVSRFHFNYMNGDWAPEWCAGSWNTGFGRGRNYRDGRDDFHDIIEFVFNHTIDDSILDPPESVGIMLRGARVPEGALTAAHVVARLVAAKEKLREVLDRVGKADGLGGEAKSMWLEFTVMAQLGEYYEKKISAANALMRYFATGSEDAHATAVTEATHALNAWRRLMQFGAAHYRKAAEGSRSYKRMLSRVQRDVVLAKTAGCAAEEVKKLGVLERAKDRPRYDFSNPELRKLIEDRLAPATRPLFMLDKVELSPKTCDILVLGREAWGFNDLAAAKKKRVIDAVEKGVVLVLFFQNFPRFDTSWLPGQIRGKDSDANSFQWTDPKHRIALKLDARDLDGRAVVNDRLVGYDESWACITDPPGGLCIRKHGKGMIVFSQLDVLHRYRERPARRLCHNIIRFAARGKAKPRVVVLDASSSGTARMLGKVNVRYQWIDDLPLRVPDPPASGRVTNERNLPL